MERVLERSWICGYSRAAPFPWYVVLSCLSHVHKYVYRYEYVYTHRDTATWWEGKFVAQNQEGLSYPLFIYKQVDTGCFSAEDCIGALPEIVRSDVSREQGVGFKGTVLTQL